MFSIPVSELTPELLAKADWWAFIGRPVPARNDQPQFKCCIHLAGIRWVDGRLAHALPDDTRCFPVTLSPDGTEVRLECPRMPDEVGIHQWGSHAGIVEIDSDSPNSWVLWYASDMCARQSEAIQAPTPEHYPRLTLEGTWVWSTRR